MKKVMVVESRTIRRKMMKEFIESYGFKVVEARTVEEALTKGAESVGVILAGEEEGRKLKELNWNSSIVRVIPNYNEGSRVTIQPEMLLSLVII